MFLALVTLSLLGDVAPFNPRPVPPPQCSADDDCVLSTFNGCCGSCCGADPHAVRRGVNEASRCAAVDCDMPDCSAVRCRQARDVSQFVPACRAGRCVAIPKAEAPAQCRIDGDCRVVTAAPPAGDSCHRSACGCCPMTQAVPIDAVVPLQQRPTGVDPKSPPTKPNFGLSTGGPPAPPPPSCSPCQQPASGVAACQSGQCVLRQPRPLPDPRPRPPG